MSNEEKDSLLEWLGNYIGVPIEINTNGLLYVAEFKSFKYLERQGAININNVINISTYFTNMEFSEYVIGVKLFNQWHKGEDPEDVTEITMLFSHQVPEWATY